MRLGKDSLEYIESKLIREKTMNGSYIEGLANYPIEHKRMDEAIASANYQELESILDEILAFSNSVSRDMMKKVFRGMLKKEIGALVAYIKEADDEDNPFYTNTELEKAKLSIVSYFLDDLEESNERVISNNQLHI